MTDKPTPRTDRMEFGYALPNVGHGVEIRHYSNREWADFARTLEREIQINHQSDSACEIKQTTTQ